MDNRCFRITADDIEEFLDQTRDSSFVDAYARWVQLTPQLDDVIQLITDAFSGVRLGDGTGLLEADGLDSYATAGECAELRSRDEKEDWRRIDVEILNRCYAAPTFLDARGFVFHLPAFLIAELNDQHGYGFIDRLIEHDRPPEGWCDLLTSEQRKAIIATLKLVAQHPDYVDRGDEIEVAINRLTTMA